MTAEAAKHFGSVSLQLLEAAGQTAGEVAGVMEPQPPLHPETGMPACSPQEHLRVQRERAARWLVGAALVFGVVWMGRAATTHLGGGSGRGLRVILFAMAGATVGFSRPEWVETKAAAVSSWLVELLDTMSQAPARHERRGQIQDAAGTSAVAVGEADEALEYDAADEAIQAAPGHGPALPHPVTPSGPGAGDDQIDELRQLPSREAVRLRRLQMHSLPGPH